MAISLITRVRSLPEGVLGCVISYIPPNKTAQIIRDAWYNDNLKLKYVRRYQVHNNNHYLQIFNCLAPIVCGSTIYGDVDGGGMCIIRTNISIGEKIRLMKLVQKNIV